MIYKVKIKDNKKCNLNYIQELKAFQNSKEYNFKPGINIIVGNNGCGKSSLMKLISNYVLCDTHYFSKMPNLGDMWSALSFGSHFNGSEFKDGIEVYADYDWVIYNYKLPEDMRKDSIVLNSVENAALYMNLSSMSTGEKSNMTLGTLFTNAFNNKEYEFPKKEINYYIEKSNDFWVERLNSLLSYYNKCKIETDKKDNAFTFLLDEPDRNLDIENIEALYDILSYEKEYTQIICVLHNPILIHKLSKLSYINFIEMTPNYINKLNKYF